MAKTKVNIIFVLNSYVFQSRFSNPEVPLFSIFVFISKICWLVEIGFKICQGQFMFL